MTIRFPEVVRGDPIKVSASTYVTFKKCPAQAGARLQGIYGPDSRQSFLGILAHRIFSRHLTSGSIPSDDFVQACREEIGGSGLNNKMASIEMRPSALAGVIEEVRGLYERFTRLPTEGFEGSEHSIEAGVAEGVDLVGTVDAVYREDLRRNPHNGWGLFGLAQALRGQGKTEEAAKVQAQFQEGSVSWIGRRAS